MFICDVLQTLKANLSRNFPAYSTGETVVSIRDMEYAVAMKSGPYYPYWRKVMKKLLKGMECTKDRVRLQETATDWTV